MFDPYFSINCLISSSCTKQAFKVEFSARFIDDWNIEFWALKIHPKESPFGGFSVRLIAPSPEFHQKNTQPNNTSSELKTPDPETNSSDLIDSIPYIQTSMDGSSVPNLSVPNSRNVPEPSVDLFAFCCDGKSLPACPTHPMLITPPRNYRPKLPRVPINGRPIENICRAVWKHDGVEWGWSSFLQVMHFCFE